jgi:RNA recognition motif-containing protein
MTTKVFIGNLAFRTTDQNLQQLFEPFGEIKSAVIITRGRRSLGYGFVEFVNHSDAEAAVAELAGKSFLERDVKVEIAKDISERPPREPREPRESREPREPKEPRQPKQPREPREPKEPRQPKQPREPREPKQEGGEGDGPAPKRKRNRNRRTKKTTNGEGQTQTTTEATSTEAPKRERKPPREKKERPVREKVLSKTTLFVANLPFSIDDDALKGIFEGPGFVSARVVRTRNGRSRGYGFVEFESEEQQQKALADKQGFEVVGQNGANRNLALSISTSVPETAEENQTQ